VLPWTRLIQAIWFAGDSFRFLFILPPLGLPSFFPLDRNFCKEASFSNNFSRSLPLEKLCHGWGIFSTGLLHGAVWPEPLGRGLSHPKKKPLARGRQNTMIFPRQLCQNLPEVLGDPQPPSPPYPFETKWLNHFGAKNQINGTKFNYVAPKFK